MDIFGGAERAPTDVILECAPELVGDVLSIHLSQQADSAALWTIRVRVQIAQGWFRLGQFVTNSVAIDGTPARVVGFASCPGARGWALEVSCPTDAEIADLVIQSSKCCGAQFGVTKNEPATFQSAYVQDGNTFGELATLGTLDNYDQRFITGGVERGRFTTGGRLGIGTATPAATLDDEGSFLLGTLALGNFAAGGSIGSAATTVDVKSSIKVAQTTAGQVLTLPSPTNATAGRVLYLSNSGTQPFTMLGQTVGPTETLVAIWNGAAWSASGVGTATPGYLQGGNSFGATAVLGTNDNFDQRFIVNGLEALHLTRTALAVNFINITQAATGGAPVLGVSGADAAIGLDVVTKSTGALRFIPGANGTSSFQVLSAGAAANILDVDSTNLRVGINQATPDYALDVTGIGNFSTAVRASAFNDTTGGNGKQWLQVVGTPTAVNFWSIKASATGIAPIVTVDGTDADIGIQLYTKGLGAFQFIPGANNTSSFQVTNAGGGTTILDVDSTNQRVGIGTATPAASLDDEGTFLLGTLALGNFAGGGSIGSAATTVDVKSSIKVAQTTAGQTLTVPSPTTATAGRLLYLSNAGTQAFSVFGQSVGATQTLVAIWNGAAWSASGVGTATPGYLQGGNSFGATGTLGTLDDFDQRFIINGLEALHLTRASSATSWVTITQGTTDDAPRIGVDGGDAAIGLEFNTKGGGRFVFKPGGNQTDSFRIFDAAGTTAVFQVDTTNKRIGIGGVVPSATLHDSGTFLLGSLALGNFAGGGSIGSAATTIDLNSSICIAQTTAGQTLTLPSPTGAVTIGRFLVVSNSGSASYTMLGAVVAPTQGLTLQWDGAAWSICGGAPSTGPLYDAQTFSATGAFNCTLPTGAYKTVRLRLWGAGGGGGSGGKSGGGVNGGAGGGGGSYFEKIYDFADLGGSGTVIGGSVGAGGTAGATSAAGAGNAGGAGGASWFGAWGSAYGGGGGAGGLNPGSGGGVLEVGQLGSGANIRGGGASNYTLGSLPKGMGFEGAGTGNSGTDGNPAVSGGGSGASCGPSGGAGKNGGNSMFGGAGGGGGGGTGAAGAVENVGGAGGFAGARSDGTFVGNGGPGGAVHAAGTAGTAVAGRGGQGGGGGGGSIGTSGLTRTGGDGAVRGGGGAGGGGSDTTTSGPGGTGGRGEVQVICQ